MFKDAGELRHTITILERVQGQADVYGRKAEAWAEVCKKRAAVRDISAREYLLQDASMREHITTFSVRYDASLMGGMRVRWRGQDYDILYINHVGYRGTQMELKCRLITGENQGGGL